MNYANFALIERVLSEICGPLFLVNMRSKGGSSPKVAAQIIEYLNNEIHYHQIDKCSIICQLAYPICAIFAPMKPVLGQL